MVRPGWSSWSHSHIPGSHLLQSEDHEEIKIKEAKLGLNTLRSYTDLYSCVAKSRLLELTFAVVVLFWFYYFV